MDWCGGGFSVPAPQLLHVDAVPSMLMGADDITDPG